MWCRECSGGGPTVVVNELHCGNVPDDNIVGEIILILIIIIIISHFV